MDGGGSNKRNQKRPKLVTSETSEDPVAFLFDQAIFVVVPWQNTQLMARFVFKRNKYVRVSR